MSVALAEPSSTRAPDFSPVWRWVGFTALTVLGALVLWRYGLLTRMAQADRTYISLVIAALYVIASAHCLVRTLAVARESQRERGAEKALTDEAAVFSPERLPDGLTGDHIRDLAEKARAQAPHRVDQTLLLRGLAERLRGSNGLGHFASDALMKLGLLGTIVGFIIMLAPIAGLDVSDKGVLQSSMGVMSEGMAVAMYTTLAGLVGSILLKLQYYMLDTATASLFARVLRLTETRVAPALERRYRA